MAFDGVCPAIARQKFDSVCQTERVHEILGTSQITMSALPQIADIRRTDDLIG